MHKLLPPSLALTVFLAACVDTTGISAESSKIPRGNANGSVVVQEFADLQCPACKAAHTLLAKPLVEKYGKTVRFEFKHFPLRSIHRYALDAAEAAECSADQGKFWEFVDLAYEKQPELKRDILADWATEAGVTNADTFDRCFRSHIKRDTVLEDYEAGRALGVNSTPTFFVNGKRVEESTLEAISKAIDEASTGMMQKL
ncbi:MAG: thioredoxin domain-containing protein [Candidatus Peregrinibacteria bacterium]|nr:thioredoxin domain-containing protein [Candidatus Peregrinibacteria bacterium]